MSKADLEIIERISLVRSCFRAVIALSHILTNLIKQRNYFWTRQLFKLLVLSITSHLALYTYFITVFFSNYTWGFVCICIPSSFVYFHFK